MELSYVTFNLYQILTADNYMLRILETAQDLICKFDSFSIQQIIDSLNTISRYSIQAKKCYNSPSTIIPLPHGMQLEIQIRGYQPLNI
jgi:hypothetical protein